MKCECSDWKNNIDKVNAPFLLQAARSGNGNQYDGKRFKFCPWCAAPLTDPYAEKVNSQSIITVF